jgi:polysaccharide pyruvyl transferase WcaK-like protein
MKISLNGYYGFANYGDDLFNLAATLGAQRWWPDHSIDVLGPPVVGVAAHFCVPRWLPARLYTSPGLAGKLIRLGFFVKAMLWSDVILHAGGSTFTSGRTLRKRIERFAVEHGLCKFAAMGISVGPFDDDDGEADTERLLRRFVFLAVRDKFSLTLVEGWKMPHPPVLGRDLAGVLPLLLPASPPGADKVLGVSMCHVERYRAGDTGLEARRNAALFEGIAEFAQRTGTKVRVFCLSCHPVSGDETISSELERHLQARGVAVEIVSTHDNMLGCWHGLAACQAVLSIRLHGAITAYLCGVPFALVEYQRKCTDFVTDIGQPAALRLGADCADAAEIVQLLMRLFDHPEMPAMSCAAYASEASLNFTQAPWATHSA